MGRLAELFEKKANGTITEDEQKEFDQLQKEAAALVANKDAGTDGAGDAEGKDDDKKNDDDASVEEETEKLAKTVADIAMGKISNMTDRFEKVLAGIEKHGSVVQTSAGADGRFIYDRALGKRVSVEDLAQQKVVLENRKAAGKKVTEVSMKTVHFVAALREKNVEKLQILSEGTAADGGYLVPDEFANMIVEDIRDKNIMRQIAAPPINITTDTFHLPGLASRPVAQWRAEKAAKATSTAQFTENVFTPYSLAVIVPLSNELVADASLGVGASIVNYVANLMSTAIAEKEEQAFWTGSGSGQPSGVDGGVYSLRTVSGGLTDSTRADSVISAFFRTPQGYRNRGVWVGNAATWEKVNQYKDTQGNYLVSNLASTVTPTLKGRPIYESNFLAGGTLLYGDFSYYQIVDREGISVRVSDEATVAGNSAFEKNLTYIRVEKRVDAELTLPAAVTKVTGLGNP